ncbi:phage terminase small subunit P27 family [Acinetobacter sp. 2JN-4]|uniref:phage terminase small subunit P27 family n=1 Tax=unclassified Acinetobacter TaxID=196816 RepID=UPI000EF9F2BD|nr:MULTISPECIES: phage terminase small subunit P27 family [unclassified Acinetobacter]MCH7309199.1 phage terminase small subunit P27 family [Acinetobacter sp. NIPH 1852]RLZ10810.1 phage terminase small subunit P27 family [Acinetobacter sp. 2JN-4]
MSGIASVPGRGRKPKPQETKQASGNKGKRLLNNNAPEFSEVTDIEVPEYITPMEHAAMMWRSVIPELLKNKVLRITDMHNVEAFCIAYHNWRSAQKEVALFGVTMTNDQGGVIKNPALTVLNEASKQMVTFGSLLGLDPSSRSRLTGGNGKPKDNPFAKVLNM